MTESTRTIETLHNLILSRIALPSFCIIGIDGTDGSGKSALARQLAPRLKADVVELDSLVEKNRGTYVDFIDGAALSSAISTCKNDSTPLIVEGVCLLAALKRTATEPSFLIYVKRVSNCGCWYDDYYCEPSENPSIATEDVKRMFAPMDDEAPAEGDNLIFEIASYHQLYKPIEKADVFFERVVDE